jgi:hypothetical protein
MATPLGPKSATDVLHISLAMPYGDPVGIQRFVDSVSNPRDPNYRKFLTPDQVGSKFGLQAAEVKRVSDYLASQGMKIRLVGKNRLSILADATVAQAQGAFNVSIKEFSAVLPGQSVPTVCFSSTESPSVPSTISPYVQYIGGLENFVRPHPAQALIPDQFRTLYSVAPLYSKGYQGEGRTVAISNWVTYGLFNIPLEYAQWNLPTPTGGVGSNVTVIPVDGANGEVSSGAQAECDIDIQAVLAMAPLCSLLLYDNAYNSDIIGVLTKEVDDNKADLISESYAWDGPTPMFVAAHNLHLSMSAQGITYMCASGDWGAQGMVNLYYPDEDPEVLSVGGTSVTTDAAGNRISEVTWGGSGGGWAPNADPFNLRPAYQVGNGLPSNVPYRLVPDVALDADPGTGYEIFINGSLGIGWGGTSCASPTMAGGLAACEQMIIANGGLPPDAAGNRRFGRIQDLLYSFNGDATVFNDITVGGNGSLPDGTPSNASVGWDTASGWGTMIFSGFASRVLNYPPVTAVSISPGSVVGGLGATGTVTFASPVGISTATVNLSSDNPCVSVPASVTVSKGATSATFAATTSGVATTTTATITARFAGSSQTTTLTVTPASLQSLTLSPSSVIGGGSSTGTVNLNGQAGPGGIVVTLASTGTAATLPSSVTVAAGASVANFTISTSGQASPITSTITGSLDGTSQSTVLTISPATLSGLTLSASSVSGGVSVTGTVTLNGAAPPSGATIALSAVNATTPASVVIPGGSSSTTFTVTTKPVSTLVTATITAKFGTSTQSASLSIQPASLQDLSIAPSTIVGGSSVPVIGTVTFTGPAPPGGISVALASSNTKLASVPGSVRLAGGSATATFPVTSKSVALSQTVTITAKFGSASRTASLTIQPAVLVALSVSPITVKGSSSTGVTGTVTLSGTAPAGGLTVTLSSSNTAAATVQASVTIPAGRSSASFKVGHKKVTYSTPVSITGILGQASATATLTVTP